MLQPAPLLPVGYDLLLGAVAAVALALLVVAVRRLVHRSDLNQLTRAVWAVAVLVVPAIGPIVFLLATRRPTSTTTPAP